MDCNQKVSSMILPAGVIRRAACMDHEVEVGSAGCAWAHSSAVASDDEGSCDEVLRAASTVVACAAMLAVDFEFCDSAGSP